MFLKDYVKKLHKLAVKYPDAKVVYAADDEGNYFKELAFGPSLGSFDGSEFINDDGTEEYSQQFKTNSVCLN